MSICFVRLSSSFFSLWMQSVAFFKISTFGDRSEPFNSGTLSRKIWKLYFKSFLRLRSRTLCTVRLHSGSSSSGASLTPRSFLFGDVADLAFFAGGSRSADVVWSSFVVLSLHSGGDDETLRLTGFSMVTTSISHSSSSKHKRRN